MLSNTTFLITGIADKHSLAMFVAKQIIKQGGKVVCTGLGVSKHHTNLSEKAKRFINKNRKTTKKIFTESWAAKANAKPAIPKPATMAPTSYPALLNPIIIAIIQTVTFKAFLKIGNN